MKQLCIFSVLLLFLASSVEPAISSILSYESIFSFGGSYADTGNGNIVLAANPALLPPYGQTFFGHPTGRRSDGRLIIDFIAQMLGLPFVPPYLSYNGSFSKGANFAVFGSTALGANFFPDSPVLAPDTSSSVQLGWFQSLKTSLCTPAQECPPAFFDKSLFFMGEFGLNDYVLPLPGKTLPQVRTIVPDVIKAIADATDGLIKQGATTVVVPGVPPMGCSPAALEMFSGADHNLHTGCVEELNDLAVHHNYLLQQALENVQTNNPDARVVYADFFTPVIEMVEFPQTFGFTQDVLRCCCGGGGEYSFNMSAACGMPGAIVCNDPNNYLYWDEHFTEAANHYIAKSWVNELRRHTHFGGVTYRYLPLPETRRT